MAGDRAEFREVLAAVRAYAVGVTFGMEAPAMRSNIAQQLGTDIRKHSASDFLTSQIRRALNTMTAAGELVKESDGNSASYYTSEAVEQRRTSKARREAEMEADRQRRRSLHQRLDKLGLTGGRFVNDGLGIARVDLSLLEDLADLAERNKKEEEH